MHNTPLNPDALEASAIAMTADPEYWREERSELSKEYFRTKAKRAVSAYLAVAQPVVSSVEELEALPLLTIVRDAHGHRAEKWTHGFKLVGQVGMYSIDLPARVLYRP